MPVQYNTPFIPSRHGFRFGNDFRHAVVGDYSTWGMCNGMARMALDFYFAGVPIPTISNMDYDTPLLFGVGATLRDTTEQVTSFRVSWNGGNTMTGKINSGSGFGAWGECGTDHALSSPAMVSRNHDLTEILFRGTNDVIYFVFFIGPSLAGARKLCGRFNYTSGYENGPSEVRSRYNPAMASFAHDHLEHYYIDYNGVLHIRRIDPSLPPPSITNWESLGTPPERSVGSGVAAVAWPGFSGAFCVARGKVWQCTKTAGSDWTWAMLPDTATLFTGSPAASSAAPGEIDLFCEGLNNLYYCKFSGGSWSGEWDNIGVPPGGLKRNCTPASVSKASGPTVYALGADGKLWYKTGIIRPSTMVLVWTEWRQEEVPYDPIMLPLKNAIRERNMETVNPYTYIVVGAFVLTSLSAVGGAVTGAIAGAAIGAGVFGVFGLIVGAIIGGVVGLVVGAAAGALISTIPLLLWLPFAGTARNFLTWRAPGHETTYTWTSKDELKKLVNILMRGKPVTLGMMQFDGFGHEVVACGIESNIPMPVSEFETYPANYMWRIKIYDPTYPNCDSVTLFVDPHSTQVVNGIPKKIYSSTGEHWKGFFVRDDYEEKPPPRL